MRCSLNTGCQSIACSSVSSVITRKPKTSHSKHSGDCINARCATNRSGWLYRVATNLGLNALRAHKRRQRYELDAGRWEIEFLAMAMGALVSADTLAGEINSGTIQAIVAKPVRRAQIVLGKWLGLAGLLALYLVLMVGGVMAVAYVLDGYVVPNVARGVALIYLEVLLVMTVTLISCYHPPPPREAKKRTVGNRGSERDATMNDELVTEK